LQAPLDKVVDRAGVAIADQLLRCGKIADEFARSRLTVQALAGGAVIPIGPASTAL
jgi:hypothetical protein